MQKTSTIFFILLQLNLSPTMDRSTILTLLICLLLPFLACNSETPPDDSATDTTPTFVQDSAQFLIELQEAIELACNDETMDSARLLLERLMNDDSIKAYPRLRHNALEHIVNICRDQDKDERLIYWAKQLLEVKRQLNFTVSSFNTQTEIGMALVRLGKTDEGLKMISASIAGLDKYRRQQQQEMKEESDAELALKNVFLFITLFFVVAASAISFYYHRMRRNITIKNKALVKMITELQDAKVETVQPAKAKECIDSMFLEIDAYVRTNRLYADPNLQRQDVLDHFSIKKSRLNALFNEHNGGLSFPAYINNIRLDEGQFLLRNHPEMNISDIATAIGFTAPNFREQFKKKYGITPTEFRQNL